MIKFNDRNLVQQGGSKTVAVPATWLNGFDMEVKAVTIEQGIDNSLIFRPLFEKVKK